MAEQAKVEEPTPRPGVTVVTSENFDDYVDEQLGVTEEAPEIEVSPEAKAATELAELEAKQAEAKKAEEGPKEGDVEGNKVFFKGKWTGKHDFGYRLHVQNEAKAKEADAKLAAVNETLKTERETREAIELERNALKAKYEPPKGELGPEPQPTQFQDLTEYAKALKEWTADATRRQDAHKAAEQEQVKHRETVTKTWNDNVAATKAEIPDYQKTLDESPVMISNEARDAIIESKVGPRILHHLASNPDFATELGKMTVQRTLIEIGKLEATLGGAGKPQTKSATVAEISKAPPPITPLRGPGSSIGTSKIGPNGEWLGTYEEFKEWRKKPQNQ